MPRRRCSRSTPSSSNTRATGKAAAAIFASLALAPYARAQSGWDCRIDDGTHKYDLTSLAGVQTIQTSRQIPPTEMVDEVRFNLCASLGLQEELKVEDQCPQSARACLTRINKKDGTDRIVSVITLADTDALKQEFSYLPSSQGLSIVLHGSPYPPDKPSDQSLNITLMCASSVSDPTFVSYDDSQYRAEWRTPAACDSSGSPPPEGGDEDVGGGNGGERKGNAGSSIGWFFLLFLLAFITYFAVGAYYNYSTYGATGLDLIPHRDFWKDFPYLIKDLLSHLCSTFTSRRSSRGGYIAV